MATSRDEILANFQGCTGIENVEDAIMWLENSEWDLLNAIKAAIPQETQNQSNILGFGGRNKNNSQSKQNGIPVTISSDFVQLPSTSDEHILEINVYYSHQTFKFHVPDTMTVECIKTLIYSDSGVPPCQQHITGWPVKPVPENVPLRKLNIVPRVLHLYLNSRHTSSDKNQDNDMDVSEEPLEDWHRNTLRESEEGKKTKESVVRTTDYPDSNNQGRRTRSGRLAKRLKRDNSKMLYDLKIFDETNHKEYSLKLPGNRTVAQVKNDAFVLTDIPLKRQIWCGWPDNVTNTSKLYDLDLDQPFHCLIIQHDDGVAQDEDSIPAPEPSSSNRVPSPVFVDVTADTDSSPEDFEDASESFAVEEDLFNEETSPRNKIAPLIPDNVEDETAGSVHFIDGYTLRYGHTAPSFLPGTLEDAIKEACYRSAREKRLLAIYLHHDGSVLTNVFCTELLGFETVLQTFGNYFVVWGWDITNPGNRDMFLSSVTRLLGTTVRETVQSISTDSLPALLILSRSRSNIELLNVIHGNIGINELLTMLIQTVDVFTDMQETEIKEEEERAARERIKMEQDKAYQQSLQMDRAKDEARKQQLFLQSQEEERIKREQQLEEEKRQAERLAVESQLPDEPNESLANQIITFRFRPPSGDFFERKFLLENELQTVFNYLLVKGFRVDEYKVISSWPRRDLSSLDGKSKLQDLMLCPQEFIILEER